MMSGIIETNGKGSTPNNEYLFGGDFSKGTAPTLLESSEAKRVKRFIENLVFRSIYQIKTGTPDKNLLRLNLTDPGQAIWELDLRTALECDPDPTLAGDLILLGHGIRATRPGGSGEGPYFYQFGTDGFTVVPENWPAATTAGFGGKIRLAYGAQVAGFVAQAMSSSCIWTLPDSDGGDGQMLSTNGSFVLSWADAAGSGTVTEVDSLNGVFIDVATDPVAGITTTGTVSADLSATGTASSTTYLRGDNTWATIAASGTVTSVATSDSTFIDLTPDSPITTTGTISAALSATGTASVSTFLRGDNSWATPSGTGTVTSVATSDSTFIDLTPDSPITATGTISAELSATGTADSTTYLRGDNTWHAPAGSGTVTSVDVDGASTGLTFSGGPVTTSGTITMAGTLAAGYGGTGFAAYTVGDILYANTTSTLAKLGVGDNGQFLKLDSGVPAWADASGTGTVTSVATSNGTFVNVTGGIITTTGTITADLSASGVASSSTFLRGDNSWAAAGGGVSSVGVSGGTTGLTFSSSPITSSGTMTMGGGPLAVDYGGTGYNTYTVGDVLFATSASSLTALGIGSEGQVLEVASGQPAWVSGGTVTSITPGADSGTGTAITTSGTITVAGGTNVTTSVSGRTITVNSTDQYVGTVTSISVAADNATGGSITSSGTIKLIGGTNITTAVSGTDVTITGTGGTVTSIATSSGSYVNISGGLITTSGTITADLSASGSPTSSHFLCGNNSWAIPGSSSGTVTSITAGTGLNGGTITTSGTIDLANTAVSAGSYTNTNLTVDAQGRLTAAASGSATGGAPADATFVTLSTDSTLTNERVLTAGTGISLTDGGAGSTVTVAATNNGTVTSITAGTGLTGGTITTSGTVALATSGATAGTYGNASNVAQVTVDAYGRITAVSNVGISGGGGSGTVTSVAISGGPTGLEFTGTPITTSGTLTVADTSVLLADYGGTGLAASSYTEGDLIYCSDVSGDVPTLDVINIGGAGSVLSVSSGPSSALGWSSISGMAQTEHNFYADDFSSLQLGLGSTDCTFTSSDMSIDTSIGTGTIDFMVAGGPSDKAFKGKVKNLKGSLGKIQELRPVEFDWNETAKREVKKEGHDIGLIAQEVEQIIPEVVGTRGEFKTLDYAKITPVLIAAIQELSSEVKDLKERIEYLEIGQL